MIMRNNLLKWRHLFGLYGVVCACLLSQPLWAEPSAHLLTVIEQAQPEQQEIAKAKKQLANLKELTLQKISFEPFHKRKKNPINESKIYCTECHGALPHLKKLRSRAFLNMHTDFIACETCHYRPKHEALSYSWFDYAQIKPVAGQSAWFHSGRTAADKTPWAGRSGEHKIVPLFNGQGVNALRSDAAAKTLYQQWKNADLEQKAFLKAKLHKPLELTGTACEACHVGDLESLVIGSAKVKQQSPLFDVGELGANATQRAAILKNTIAEFFKHYKPDPEPQQGNTDTQKEPEEQRIQITNFLK